MPDRRRLDQPRRPNRVELPRLDPEAFGRWSEGIARFMGTARFLVYMTIVICAWVGWNTIAPERWRFDPYTFTFLTLVLSLQASYAAPLILLAQNRQADRDRLAMEEDRRRAAMQKADTEYLSREIASLRHALGEVATRDFLRSELSRLVDEIDESAQRRDKQRRKELRKLTRRRDTDETHETLDETLTEPGGEPEETLTSPGVRLDKALADPSGSADTTPADPNGSPDKTLADSNGSPDKTPRVFGGMLADRRVGDA